MLEIIGIVVIIFVMFLFHHVVVMLSLFIVYMFIEKSTISNEVVLDSYILDTYSNDMLSSNISSNLPYITILPFGLRTIFWKYAIKTTTPVWRWSKLHGRIKKRFKQLKS